MGSLGGRAVLRRRPCSGLPPRARLLGKAWQRVPLRPLPPSSRCPLQGQLPPTLQGQKPHQESSELHRLLKRAAISTRMDDSGASIGRKYSRSDEVGTPFACTIDFDTLGKGNP